MRDQVPIGHAAAAADLSDAVAWAESFGLADLIGSTLSVSAGSSSTHFTLDWRCRDRGGATRSTRTDVSRSDGTTASGRVVGHWSEPPGPSSRVVVVPDVVTFWMLQRALGGASVFPFVLVAPTGGLRPPPEWLDAAYWRFRAITILRPGVPDPDGWYSTFVGADQVDFGIALPPSGIDWAAWLRGRAVAFEDLDRIAGDAFRHVDLLPVRLSSARPGLEVAGLCRRPDSAGRLCRVVAVDGRGAGEVPLLARSDGSCARLLMPAPLGWRAADLPDHFAGGWTSAGAARFLGGERIAPGCFVGRDLVEILVPVLGLDRCAVARMVAWAALTHVHEGFRDLPLMIARGGTRALRLRLAAVLEALCHAPLVVARTRAMQMARLADASLGTLLLDEPGPLCGPLGATEVGRFLEGSCRRAGSAYNTLSTRSGLRRLHVFGPRIVLGATASGLGLACGIDTLDLGDADAEPEAAVPDLADARDLMYAWSMSVFALLDGVREARATQALARVSELLGFENVDERTRPEGSTRSLASGDVASPEALIELAFAACATGGHVAMAQLMLELATRGADPETMSPERIGRWLSSRPEIDQSSPIERRRLNGRVSRIYALAGGAASDPIASFGFCLGRSCGQCRYAGVCGDVLPGAMERKLRDQTRG